MMIMMRVLILGSLLVALSSSFVLSPPVMTRTSSALRLSAPSPSSSSTAAQAADHTLPTTLTYLEGNSWHWSVNGVSILCDPVFATMDFGMPLMYAANKRVLKDYDALLTKYAKEIDVLIFTQGLDDHCNANTLEPLSKLLPSNVPIFAAGSAEPKLSRFFPSSKVTYLRPGDEVALRSLDGEHSAHLVTTTGALVGPPWQDKENGYLMQASKGQRKGSLYYEPHCFFDTSELRKLSAETVISPVVSQKIGAYTLVDGREKAVDLAKLLRAENLVTLPNAEMDAKGLLTKVVSPQGTVAEIGPSVKRAGITLKEPQAGQAFSFP